MSWKQREQIIAQLVEITHLYIAISNGEKVVMELRKLANRIEATL